MIIKISHATRGKIVYLLPLFDIFDKVGSLRYLIIFSDSRLSVYASRSVGRPHRAAPTDRYFPSVGSEGYLSLFSIPGMLDLLPEEFGEWGEVGAGDGGNVVDFPVEGLFEVS